MILDEVQIKELARAEVDDWIKTARNDSVKLKVHFFGEGKTEYLKRIEGLENAQQLKLRKEHSPSNKHIVENLLRPFDNVWSAKGGLIKAEMKTDPLQERFNEEIANVKNGMSDKAYLKDIWSPALFTDPAGLLFMEVTPTGSDAYLTQKTIFDIKNMKLSGMIPEYVVLEPDETITKDEDVETNKKKIRKKAEAEKINRLWIIDDVFYWRVEVTGNDVEVVFMIKNSFERVPGIINSPEFDTSRMIHVSPFWKQIELLDNYLVNNSVKEIHQFLHGYPIFFRYPPVCESCKGKKERKNPDDGIFGECTTCNGSGISTKKDVSDGILLAPPKDKDAPTIDKPAGYISPSIDTWEQQRIELDWKFNQLFFSHWGTTVERKNNETATGRFIDAQPVNNRLNDYSDSVEIIHKWVLKMFAKFVAENSVKSISVSYGRRYLIETPDQIWEKYLKSKKEGAPATTLNLLLEQFYESEFQHNEMMRDYFLKLMRIEPFVHKTVEEVMLLPISDEDKKTKLFFQDWVAQIMITEVNEKTVEQLKSDLATFVETKQLDNNG